MPHRPVSRTASIPSKRRGHREKDGMQGSLTVRRLEGVTSPVNNTMSSISGVTSPAGATLASLKSSFLKNDLKKTLANVENDQRSLELFVRLLKAGPFVQNLIADENTKPDVSRPNTPAPSLNIEQNEDDVTDSDIYVTEYLTAIPITPRPKIRPVTTETAIRFRKNIEELREARERFGVSMSVNGTIAKARNAQQRNEKSRRKAGRERLPNLERPSSRVENADRVNTPRVVPVLDRRDSWLSLSGQKIQLRHQGHVERVLVQAQHGVTMENSHQFNGRQRRTIRSAPPKTSLQLVTERNLAWTEPRRYGNKSVINKVNRTLQTNRTALSFSNSFQVYGPNDVINDTDDVIVDTTKVEESERDSPPREPRMRPREESKETPAEVTSRVSEQSMERDDHDSDASSRPTSGAMPRPVRSIVIKLPDSVTVTSSTITPPQTTQSKMTSRTAVAASVNKPSVRFAFGRPEVGVGDE